MSPFVVFAIVLTLVLLLYYGVMIALDIRKLGKQPSKNKEEFDVSSMQEEEEAHAVDEAGYVVPDVQEEKKEEQPSVEQPVVKSEKPSAAAQKIERTEREMANVPLHTSCAIDSEAFMETITKGKWLGGKFRPKRKNNPTVA